MHFQLLQKEDQNNYCKNKITTIAAKRKQQQLLQKLNQQLAEKNLFPSMAAGHSVVRLVHTGEKSFLCRKT